MIINPTELRQIIKEEAIRLKKRMILEAERSAILSELQKMDEDEADSDVKIKSQVIDKVEKTTKNILASKTPEELALIKSELESAGLLLGTSSPKQIESKIKNLVPPTMNEALTKEGIYGFLSKAGIGAAAIGIIVAALGSMNTLDLSYIADITGDVVNPGPQVIAGLITAVLGAVGTVVAGSAQQRTIDKKNELSPEQKTKNAAQIIANRKARGIR